MSTRSDRAAERKAVKKAEKDLAKARSSVRKAFDLKDPRFLGEAAVAATRGPAGLALFGASRGLQAVRERRAEQAEILGNLASDAREHADSLREQTAELVAPEQEKRRRRIVPLVLIGVVGGAAVAAGVVLRGRTSPVPPAPPAYPQTPRPAGPESATASETGEDLTVDAADPEGPGDQDAAATPAAESAAPGAGAGSAPQPSDTEPDEDPAGGKG